MALLDPLPPALAETLATFPHQGERNLWFFEVAARSRHVASAKKVHRFLNRIVSRAGWSDRDFSREIDRAVTRAFNPGLQASPSCPSCPSKLRRAERSRAKRVPWPKYDADLFDRYVSTKPLFSTKPVCITSEAVLDSLFVQDALLCLSMDIRSAVTQPRSLWRGMEASMEFMVANPMTFPTGKSKDGRLSHRCHDNATRSRLYQVIEFDRGTALEQAAILSALHSPKAPLILVVWSGGKSMHGWFDVRNLSEHDKARFFSAAYRLGADASLWDPCKLVRMPGGRRANGNAQPVLYFNPDAG